VLFPHLIKLGTTLLEYMTGIHEAMSDSLRSMLPALTINILVFKDIAIKHLDLKIIIMAAKPMVLPNTTKFQQYFSLRLR